MRWTACRLLAAGSAAVVVVGLTACSGDDSSAPETTTTLAPVVPTIAARVDDGVLRLGALLPQSGPAAGIGEAMVDSVQWAVDEANALGGFGGMRIELVVRDEGSDATSAAAAIDELIDEEDVDAIIGPTSSNVTLTVLERIVSAGVIACSPTATASSLTAYPDPDGLFFRTIPSDELEAKAMAEVISETGLAQVAIAAPDDDYGRTMTASLLTALEDEGITQVGHLDYDPEDEEFDEEALELLNGDPPVLAVIGDADSGARLVTALAANDLRGRTIVMSSALRRPSSPAVYAALSDTQLGHLTGVSPEVFPSSEVLLAALGVAEADPSSAFATQVVDCVNLLVLAAASAGSDNPAAIASQVLGVSRDGSSCADLATCLDGLQRGLGIDYDGPGGLLRLDTNGDVTTGVYEQYGFTADGEDMTMRSITVDLTP